MGWLDDEDQAESIFGGDDYFSHVFRSGLQSDAFDPDSEEAQNYLKLAKEPPPSEGMYSDYMSRRPILGGEDTKPSIGRRLMSAVAAMSDDRNGITLARDINRQPYENAFTNWKTEGSTINQQALAADRGRTRELGAAKELLSMKGRQAREERLQKGLDSRLQSKADAAEIARLRRNESDRRYQEAEERRMRNEERATRNEERGLRNEERSIDSNNRVDREAKVRSHERLAIAAKDQAHEIIDNKFPNFFVTDEDGDRVLNPNLTSTEKARALQLIKEREDILRRSFRLDEPPSGLGFGER